ncbi:LytTR family transcriptional regulator DNA-binding domain-containing protein [Leuconostoc pseudomesenteroides]|uniref:LytTR family transcriptional regulator DNA-binding domain-containing protein n=1 Tax=Leuconostoc pseudomesenteroides TaxID=33968 RepID=UPI00301C0A42
MSINQISRPKYEIPLNKSEISRYHDKFLQVHASFCVNQDFIQQYQCKDKVLLLTTGDLLPVSRRFKHNLSYLQP